MNLRDVLGWCRRDQVNPARDAAVREKRLALDAIEPQPSPLTRDDMEGRRDR